MIFSYTNSIPITKKKGRWVKPTHLNLGHQGINGNLQVFDLPVHLRLPIFQRTYDFIELVKSFLQCAHLDQAINAATGRRHQIGRC